MIAMDLEVANPTISWSKSGTKAVTLALPKISVSTLLVLCVSIADKSKNATIKNSSIISEQVAVVLPPPAAEGSNTVNEVLATSVCTSCPTGYNPVYQVMYGRGAQDVTNAWGASPNGWPAGLNAMEARKGGWRVTSDLVDAVVSGSNSNSKVVSDLISPASLLDVAVASTGRLFFDAPCNHLSCCSAKMLRRRMQKECIRLECVMGRRGSKL